MTLLAVGGLGEDIQCTHVQYRIHSRMCAHAYYSLYNRDYFVGLIFMVSKYYLQKLQNWTPRNFHAIPDGRLFIGCGCHAHIAVMVPK